MKRRSVLMTFVPAVLLVPAIAFAAGYSIFEQGAAALGRAGAAVASTHDASALFYNAGAVADLEHSQLMLGGAWLTTRTSFAGIDPQPGFGNTEEMVNGSFFPPNAYWTQRLGRRWAYGLGVNAPFGLGVEWQNPDDFAGRKVVTKADLNSINGNATLAFAPSPKLSLGVGLDALMAKVELHRRASFFPTTGGLPLDDADVTLSSDYTKGFGWNMGLLLKPTTAWTFGLSYRSEIDVDVTDGSATFDQILSGDVHRDSAVAANMPANQTVATTLTFPATVSFGLAWKPAPEWTWELDANYTQWSAFEALDLTFPANKALNSSISEFYDDTWRIGFGAEHRLKDYTFRFGYYHDEAAAPTESVSPLLPDAPRHGLTLGFGRPVGKLWLDVYDLALFVEKRSTEGKERDGFDGVYKSFVNALGFDFTYSW